MFKATFMLSRWAARLSLNKDTGFLQKGGDPFLSNFSLAPLHEKGKETHHKKKHQFIYRIYKKVVFCIPKNHHQSIECI